MEEKQQLFKRPSAEVWEEKRRGVELSTYKKV